jgi:multisubunit Na+/H+ antiporter MnhE subunit
MPATLLSLITIWLLLTRRLDVPALVVGLLAVGLVCIAQRTLFRQHDRLMSTILLHPWRSLRYAVSLAWRFVVSTGYTIRLILLGNEEGRIVALPLRLRHPIGQLLLLNSITLTPSTISLLIEGDLLYIHWLRARNAQGDWETIKETLERELLAIFPEEAS